MSVVLVTGGAGFIGSHLCDRLLVEGHRVVAVDDLSTGRIDNLDGARNYGDGFQFSNIDVRADGLLTLFERYRPEVVMHLAAQSGVRPSLEDPANDASINIMGTLNVLRCALAVGSGKVVYAASGGTIYGEPRSVPVGESSARDSSPQSPYGISKKTGLEYLSFYERHRGLDFTALALGNVYGPRQDPDGEAGVIAIFASHMLAGRTPVVFGDGDQTRDYVFVDDTVNAFVLAMDQASGELVNIGTGVETSVNDLYRMLADILRFDGTPDHGPQPPGELRRIALDNTLAGSVLGWHPRINLEAGLGETLAYLQRIRRGSTQASGVDRDGESAG